MTEVLAVMGLEALVCLLLALAAFLWCVAAYGWPRSSWLRKAQVLAEIALCLCWANWILGALLAPRYLHGSARAAGAGRTPDGAYVVVDLDGERSPVTEAEFGRRERYERWSWQLPWYVTPPAILLIVAGWLRRGPTVRVETPGGGEGTPSGSGR